MRDREKEIEYLLYLKSELIKQTRKEIKPPALFGNILKAKEMNKI